MYEDAWYTYVPEAHSQKEDAFSTHRRRESLLKQPNGTNQMPIPPENIMELLENPVELKGPPKATLARRAKSYSDFYEVAINYLNKPAREEKPKDLLGDFEDTTYESSKSTSRGNYEGLYEDLQDDLVDASHEEFHLYRNQLSLSERHLQTLVDDTTSALDSLAKLSASFKAVESQTTAFQAQCEDLLGEQKRIRDLADEVGLDLQYYAYLEPLTRRLNAPGSGRLIKSDDFLDMLMNLNTCIDFMDQHPDYRDSTVYKTRYTTLLERSLNLVQLAFTSALRDITDDVSKQLKAKGQSETAEYVLLYGKYEPILSNLGYQVERLLKTSEFSFGQSGQTLSSYVPQWHELYRHLLESYLKSREPVGPLLLKNLRKFGSSEPKPDTDFQSFARRCVQYVFDICHNELTLLERFFQGGPLFAEYSDQDKKVVDYAGPLEDNRLSHLAILHAYLNPFLSSGDLQRICDLTNWLETMYLAANDEYSDGDRPREDRRSTAQALLSKHLWPLSDALFLKAATEIEHFKPAHDDLVVTSTAKTSGSRKDPAANGSAVDEQILAYNVPTATVSSAYPTVKTAVKLLIMYNDGIYERPRAGDVLYEIVHQATESLQKAATIIKRNTTIMDAQLFLIKNLMLIENLFMTHEIPDSVRQSAEFDFSPIWDTIKELQDRKQLFNPLAYITPLVKGQLLPGVVDHLLDARKELEKVLVQQITAFTKHWQSRLSNKDLKKSQDTIEKASVELEDLLNKVFSDETTKGALWKMIRAEDY